jgi:AhpD family alkylhydroperoxidase
MPGASPPLKEQKMAEGIIEKFQKQREELNQLVMDYAGQGTKRFYSLDSQAYREGALSCKVKELLGLVASFVLRCDDCIKYHVIRCFEEGVSDEELEEALFIGLIVGGTITIPHQRRAMQAWDELKKRK